MNLHGVSRRVRRKCHVSAAAICLIVARVVLNNSTCLGICFPTIPNNTAVFFTCFIFLNCIGLLASDVTCDSSACTAAGIWRQHNRLQVSSKPVYDLPEGRPSPCPCRTNSSHSSLGKFNRSVGRGLVAFSIEIAVVVLPASRDISWTLLRTRQFSLEGRSRLICPWPSSLDPWIK